MPLILKRSDDGRVMSQSYDAGGESAFCLAEQAAMGVLITEFNSDSEVNNQVATQGNDCVQELSKYTGIDEFGIKNAGRYTGIRIEAQCSKCGNTGLLRELDRHAPSKITDVPVIPIFLCSKCGVRHYSLTDRYLGHLVSAGTDLFNDDELAEIGKDAHDAVKALQEHVIRIFASKKIYRIRLG